MHWNVFNFVSLTKSKQTNHFAMKKSAVLLLFVAGIFFSNTGFAQSLRDTIVTKSNEQIICKITKITDTEIEYKKSMEADAIVFVISKDKVRQIRYADGTVEVITRDEMDMNAEYEILDKRQAIKFHFFSPFRDYMAFTYEKSIKMGTNIEATAGIINSSFFSFGMFDGYEHLTQGMFLSSGVKFNLGNSYYMKGMKFSHPLKGKYFKPELTYTAYSVRNMDYTIYDDVTYNSTTYRTDKSVNGLALMLNYGNQYILGNTLTFGFSVGIGYSFAWTAYSNKDLENALNQQTSNTYYDLYDYTANMFNHVRAGERSAIGFSSTITLGYIFK